MDNKISFYFERLEGLSYVDDLNGLIDLHVGSFERHGWEVVRLDESAARQHPLYDVFNDESSVFATSQNGWEYTRTCYMRWLAYASAGHFFADFDTINYGFTPQDALDMRDIAGGPTFLSGATAIGLFQGSDYDQILNAFLDYQKDPFVRGMLEIDVNDMNILLQCRSDLFSLIQTNDVRIARDYSWPGWDVAQLVHYPYAYTKPPRSKTVRAERPPLLSERYERATSMDSDLDMGATVASEPSPPETWPAQMSRVDIVNHVLSLFDAPNYLEIGVNTGNTFFNVRAGSKVAVDPAFLFDVEDAQGKHAGSQLHSVESDAFFASIATPQDRFDVIYLDGLHTLEQTLRDFCNALAFLKPGGVVVVDDVIPSSYHASLPDPETAWHVRKHLGVEDGMWMGDVYRLVYFIQTFFQQYRYATVVENHGQLVVWRAQRGTEEIVKRRVEEIGRAPFESVLLEASAFNRLPFSEIMALLRGR